MDDPAPNTPSAQLLLTRPLRRLLERARPPISGPGQAVDHERQPGVPPPDATDFDDILDIEGAESFPASDPPSGW